MPDAWQHFLVTLDEMKRAIVVAIYKLKNLINDVLIYLVSTYIYFAKKKGQYMIFNSSNYSVRICLESCGYFFVKLILKIFDKRYVCTSYLFPTY